MDVLEGYTTEEIQAIARKHNERAVINAISNGAIIMVLSTILMRSDINISEIADDKITEIINESYQWINQIADNLPMGDMVSSIYAKLMGIMEMAIDKVGVIGITLASKSVSFVMDTITDGTKTVKMKKEIEEIRTKIHETYEFEPNNRSR